MLNHAIWKALNSTQRQQHVAMTTGHQRNTVADKHRNDADDELIDRPFIQY